MGSCTSQPQHPPLHERLDEYDDKHFLHTGSRISIRSGPKGWRKHLFGRNPSSADEEVIDWGPNDRATPIGDSNDVGTSPTSTQTMATISSASTSTPALKNSKNRENEITDFTFVGREGRSSKNLSNDGTVDGWRVKRHGKALQLRLAKHRFFQMAVSRQNFLEDNNGKEAMSPLSLDSSFFPQEGNSRNRIPLPQAQSQPTGDSNDRNGAFDSHMGAIWREIARTNVVTATAIARHPSETSFFSPLLLAMGDEKGVIVVTQINDDDQVDASKALHDSDRIEENALEYSIEGRIRSLDFGDHRSLVAGGDGCRAWILQVVFNEDRLERLVALRQYERIDRIYDVKFSRDSRFLAIGGFDCKCSILSMASVWDKRDGPSDDDSLEQLLDQSAIELSRPGLIHCLDWSTEFLAVASNKLCAFYDVSNLELVHETPRRLTTIQALRYNSDGTYVAMGERDVVILEGKPPFRIHCEISNTPNDSKVTQFRYRITSLCWSSSGSFLAVAGSDGTCLVVETKGFALVHQIQRKESIEALSWTQQFLVISDESNNVALVKAGAEVGETSQMDDYSSAASSSHFSSATNSDWVLQDDAFRDIEDCSSSGLPQDVKSQSNITAVAFSQRKTSSYLAYAADDCSLTILTTRDWKVVFQIEFAKPIRSLAFSHTNNFLAMGGDESILYVLSVPTRSMILNTIMTSSIHSVAFSKRDERLSIGVEDGVLSMLVVDAEFEPSGDIDHSESAVLCQAWSSRTLAVGRRDGTVTLFDTEKAFCNFFVPLAEFSSTRAIRSLSYGVSENFLAIGNDIGVSILSRKGGWILCNRINTGHTIFALQWSPAGRYLAFAGSNECLEVCDTITWVGMHEVKQALPTIFASKKSSVTSLDWSIDCKWMAIGSFGSGIHVLNTSNWKLLGPSTDGLRLGSSIETKK